MDMNHTDAIERKARIFNVQKYNVYDGPGIRTLVFFQGCPLRCKWCANPEGMEQKYRVMLKKNLCTSCGKCTLVCPEGIHSISDIDFKHKINRTLNCIGCHSCEEACMMSALSIVGEEKTISQLLSIIKEDKMFYQTSGGGVTLGGGEVLMQPEAAASLLMACKMEGIHTAIETCGYASLENVLKVAEFTDLFLFDLKHIDSEKHFELTGVHNERILENLSELLRRRYHVKVRMPLLKGVNDGEQELEKTLEFLMPYRNLKNFEGIDLLPYHKLGVNKYNQLDKEYPVNGDPSLSEEDLNRLEQFIKEYDFPVKIIRH